MLTIGFAGTAKNTGKTTAALYFLGLCQKHNLPVALTSIGYDGESLDNVTGLPKPRYHVSPGTLVATAEHCLAAGSAHYHRVTATGIHTILGEVILVEITRPGSVVLAGPNHARDLTTLLNVIRRRDSCLAILDGALNRLVPLTVADGLVLSTGAAFDERIPETAAHAGATTALFQIPHLAETAPAGICIHAPGQQARLLPGGSLLSEDALNMLLAALPARVERLVLPGTCLPRFFESLLARSPDRLQGCQFVFGSPFHLLASGNPLHWLRVLAAMPSLGQTAACLHTVPLRLVTVNPGFPRYLTTGRYLEDSVDKDQLLQQVRSSVAPVPVENIREPVCANLLALFPEFHTEKKSCQTPT